MQASPPDRRPSLESARTTALLAAFVALASILVAVALQSVGRSSRRGPAMSGGRPGAAEIVLARSDAEVVAAWRSRQLRGLTLVHAGRFLHFVEDDGVRLTRRTLTVPGTGAELDRLLAASAAPPNHLWVAASLGVVRRIFYVSPPRALEARLASLGVGPGSLPIRVDAETFPRNLHRSPPRLDEPVLLDVNASWFDESDATALLGALRASGLAVALATISLAEDAEDVSPAARDAARAFAAELAARPPERRP